MTSPPPRICLNMIVRNEARIIRRALLSVVDYIDYWVVSDTGSSDETRSIIVDFFNERGVRGELHEHRFDNFASARNRSLTLARQSGGEFDYILLMDADMELRVDDPGFRDRLREPAYEVLQKSGISYWNPRLLRRDCTAFYQGVTHEHLALGGSAARFEGIWFADATDGANRSGKFERDISLLEEGLRHEPDNQRYVYYLAQSHRDAGHYEEAAAAYQRRYEMGGWDEERWSAMLNRARCLLALGDEAGFVKCATEAFQMRSHRAEPLLDLARYYRMQNMHEQAMLICELAAHIPRPSHDRLFIEDFAYDFGIRQEISICGFYCEAKRHKDLGILACNGLALDPAAPREVRDLARANLVYYAKPASALMASWSDAPLRWSPPMIGTLVSAAVAALDRELHALVGVARPDAADARAFLLRLGEQGAVLEQAELLPPSTSATPESVRLFAWKAGLWCLATPRDGANEAGEVILARLELGAPGEARMTDVRRLPRESSAAPTGNWVPLVSGDELEFIDGLDPVRLLDEQGRLVGESRPEAALDHLCGSSGAIAFREGWLLLTHEVQGMQGRSVHLHRFVWLDAQRVPRRVTEAFYLQSPGPELASGFAAHPDGDRIVIGYAINGAEAWLATVLAADIWRALTPHEERS